MILRYPQKLTQEYPRMVLKSICRIYLVYTSHRKRIRPVYTQRQVYSASNLHLYLILCVLCLALNLPVSIV